MEDLDLVAAHQARADVWCLLAQPATTSARRYRERGPLAHGTRRNLLAALAWACGIERARIAAWLSPMSETVTGGDAAAGRRSALRRLLSYIARNKRYYAIWLAATLVYTTGFVALPKLVGWTYAAHEQAPRRRRDRAAGRSGSRWWRW